MDTHCCKMPAALRLASPNAAAMAAPSGICWAPMLPIGPTAPVISLTSKLVPALIQAAAASRNFAESPSGQIIPMKGATQPQPAGAPSPLPTADGVEPAETAPVRCGTGRASPCPETLDIASANE